eukprot:COSAG03_NODE_995_length_5074_cov_4.211658_1_plen_73_part_00
MFLSVLLRPWRVSSVIFRQTLYLYARGVKLGDECSQSFCSAESRESSMVPKNQTGAADSKIFWLSATSVLER